jgi:dTDP-4-dehydrorhamnose 3,5-epimerase
MQTDTIQDVAIINLEIFEDRRGAFEVIWEDHLSLFSGRDFDPSSLNISYNIHKHTLRGMHFQESPYQQAKLVTCVNGKLLDIVVDLRRGSASYKNWAAYELSGRSGKSLYIPQGLAHGYLTLEDNTTLAYLNQGRYMPEKSRVLRWNDPEIAIDWPTDDPILSDQDKTAAGLSEL